MKSKSRCQQIHAAKRARERLGINLSANKQEQICQMIRAGQAQFVRKDSNRVSVFDVQFEGITIRAVYDRIHRTLATVMTPEFA